MQGKKPIVKEVGPFVYKVVTVKDSFDKDNGKKNFEYNDDGETIKYRPRLLLSALMFSLHKETLL